MLFMGWTRKQLTPEVIRCMTPEDQAKLGVEVPQARPSWELDPHPPFVTDKLEREEQRQFANWCLLHNYACVWHSTRARSRASVGCPDFIVGRKGITWWIEFKRAPNPLTEDQKKFKALLEGQQIPYFVVYSCGEAIALVEADKK